MDKLHPCYYSLLHDLIFYNGIIKKFNRNHVWELHYRSTTSILYNKHCSRRMYSWYITYTEWNAALSEHSGFFFSPLQDTPLTSWWRWCCRPTGQVITGSPEPQRCCANSTSKRNLPTFLPSYLLFTQCLRQQNTNTASISVHMNSS